MKIRNFEYFASRVARKFDTVIQRSLYNYNGVWFANGMYMDFDGEFLYISESSNGVPTTVMACFVNCYNTQKDFFHDLDLLVSCNCIKKLTKTANTEEHEAEETSTTETTETKPEETATTETARSAKRKTDNQDIIENEDLDGIIENENLDETEQTWKRYNAITNPEWHHVSLATLANIDFDMLDEKRQLYLSLYREIKELIKDLHNCKSCYSYGKRLVKIYSRNADLVDENKVTSDYIRYVTRKVSMCNVECGVWTSASEESTGYHKSRRYNQATLRH